MKKYTAQEFQDFIIAVFIILGWLGGILNLVKLFGNLFQ